MKTYIMDAFLITVLLVKSCCGSIPSESMTTSLPSPQKQSRLANNNATTARPFKCCVLCEPSPITYVSGYANRFQEMLRFLRHNGDDVQLVTAENVVSERPQEYLGFPIHYTRGIRFPLYPAMTISFDWTFRVWRVIHQHKPDLIHVSSP